MKCIKCGGEVNQNGKCPRCGDNPIQVNKEYYERRKKWEEAQAETDEKETKTDSKKIMLYAAGAVTIVFLVMFLYASIKYVVLTVKYQVYLNSSKMITLDTEAGIIYKTCDGVYAYTDNITFASLDNMTNINRYCSKDGKIKVLTGYEEQNNKNNIYISIDKESKLLYETNDIFEIKYVGSDGNILLEEHITGDYGIVMESKLYEIGPDGKKVVITEELYRNIETGENKKYYYQTSDKAVWKYTDGKKYLLFYNTDNNKIVYANSKIYRLEDGRLIDESETIIDENVEDIIKIYGSDEISYKKDNKNYILCANDTVIEYDEILSEGAIRVGNKVYNRDKINNSYLQIK